MSKKEKYKEKKPVKMQMLAQVYLDEKDQYNFAFGYRTEVEGLAVIGILENMKKEILTKLYGGDSVVPRTPPKEK